jgi:hypothetical protein
MATETAVLANETEIANALNVFGLGNFTDNVLDEIELQRHLKISLEQADRGELIPASEVKKEIGELFANGHFDR